MVHTHSEKRAVNGAMNAAPFMREGMTPFRKALRAVQRADMDPEVLRAALRKANSDALSSAETADRLPISPATVRSMWRSMGLSSRAKSGRRQRVPDAHFMKAHADGLNAVEAAEQLLVHPSTVWEKWRRMGLKPGKGLKREEIYHTLRAAHDLNLSLSQTGRIVHLSASSVRKNWARMGLKPHNRPGGQPTVSDETILCDLAEGLSQADIMRKHGISVYNRIKRLEPVIEERGIRVVKKTVRTKVTDEQIRETRDMDPREAAVRLGVNRTTVVRRRRNLVLAATSEGISEEEGND